MGERVRATTYFIDFHKMSESDGWGEMVGMMTDLIRRENPQFEFIAGHRRLRETHQGYQKHHPLVLNVARHFRCPSVEFSEYEWSGALELGGDISIANSRAIIVVDAIRTGDTVVKLANEVRKRGAEVRHVFAYMVRPEGEKRKRLMERMKDERLGLHFIVSAKELLEKMRVDGLMSEEQYMLALRDEDFA